MCTLNSVTAPKDFPVAKLDAANQDTPTTTKLRCSTGTDSMIEVLDSAE